MKSERTVRECSYRPSPTSAETVVLVDPDPLSPKRYSHCARWTWNEEEGIFFASLVLQTHIASMPDTAQMAEMAATIAYLLALIDDKGGQRKDNHLKKRLTPKRKRA
jgi:hypothetical protein